MGHFLHFGQKAGVPEPFEEAFLSSADEFPDVISVMAIHVLQRTQVIRASIEECWEFFSNPRNVTTITPRALDLVVLNDVPAHVHPGLMIVYCVRPLLGVPLIWLTEITHVEELRSFVDEQRVGPYRLWHHEHFFKPLGDGRVEIRDRVHYILPFAPLSEVVHPFLVRPKLEKIFEFREQAVRQRFGDDGESNPNGS